MRFSFKFHPSHPFNRSESPFFCPVAHVKPRKVAVERMPSGRVQSSQREKPLYSIPARIEVGTSRCYFFWWEECFKLVANHQGWGVFGGGMLGLRKVKAGDLLCPKQFLVCNKKTVLYSDGQITQCKLNIEIYRNSSSLSSINVCSAMLSSQTCSIIWVVQPLRVHLPCRLH